MWMHKDASQNLKQEPIEIFLDAMMGFCVHRENKS